MLQSDTEANDLHETSHAADFGSSETNVQLPSASKTTAFATKATVSLLSTSAQATCILSDLQDFFVNYKLIVFRLQDSLCASYSTAHETVSFYLYIYILYQ